MNLVSIVEGHGEPDTMRVLLPKVINYLNFDSISTETVLKAQGRGDILRIEKYLQANHIANLGA